MTRPGKIHAAKEGIEPRTAALEPDALSTRPPKWWRGRKPCQRAVKLAAHFLAELFSEAFIEHFTEEEIDGRDEGGGGGGRGGEEER